MADTVTEKPSMNDAFSAAWSETEDEVLTTTDAADEGVSGVEGTKEVLDQATTADGESAPAPGERPRDEKGRFAPKDGTEAPVAPAPGEGTTPVTTQANAVVATPPASTTAPEAEPVGQTLQFKIEGSQYELQGATKMPDGSLRVSPEHAAYAEKLIHEGAYKMLHWQQHLETEREKARTEAREVSDKVLDQVGQLVEKIKTAYTTNDQKLLNEVISWALDYDRQLPTMRAQAEADRLKAELEKLRSGEKQQQEAQQTETLERQKAEYVKGSLAQTRKNPEAKVLTDSDWSVIEKHISRLGPSLWSEQDGQWVCDDATIQEFITDRIGLRKEIIGQAKAAQEAAKFNAGQSKPNAQPAPGQRKPVPARTAPKEPDEREVRRAAKRSLVKGSWLDEDDEE